MKHVYVHYPQGTGEQAGRFAFCPVCRTKLAQQPLGREERPMCPGCGFVQFRNPAPAVGVLIVEERKVLLGLRRNPPGQGKWALPSGYVEHDEDFVAAAIREVREETGLEIKVQAVIGVSSSFLSPQAHFLAVYLLARVVGGEIVAEDDLEVVRWFSLDGLLPEMAFPEDVDVVADCRSGDLRQIPLA